jgi:hypothetical protein
MDFEPTQASSNSTDWLSCFNATEVSDPYARAIYNTSQPPEGFSFAKVDLVYPNLLHGLNLTCFLSSPHIYRRGVIGALFVDYPERTRIPNGALINRGGARFDPKKPPPLRIWPWVEVIHTPHFGVAAQGGSNLWMYIARGSGLWFNPGRVLALSDVWDLAVYLNATSEYNPRSVGSKTALMQLATRRLRGVVDSIAFLFHVDGGCCQRMVMRELVSLLPHSAHCPVSSEMRRGWPPDNLVRCPCTHAVAHHGVC